MKRRSRRRTPAYLVRQLYKEGRLVAAGDTLFLLDPRVSHAMHRGLRARCLPCESHRAGRRRSRPPRHGAGDHVEAGEELTTIAQMR